MNRAFLPRRLFIGASLLACVISVAPGVSPSGTSAQTPPGSTVSADGRSATDGRRTLAVSKAAALNPAGEAVAVSGAGYDIEKGVYIAFCVIPPAGSPPTPCGGGMDMTGSGGSAAWISSSAPSYGAGLANSYGPGGTFQTTMNISPQINAETDCRVLKCAIVSRNDHTRTADRSQDILVPVTFAAAGASVPVASPPAAVPPAAAPATAPTTVPAAPIAQPTAALPVAPVIPRAAAAPAAPASTLSGDGRTATSGSRSLSAVKVDAVSSAGELVKVSARGFDEARGVYVSLCAVTAAPAAPGPCAAGASGVSVWVSSNPPDYGKALAQPYRSGGVFEVTLDLKPVIDAATDCRVVRCAIVTRNDDTAAADRSQDLLLPVTFGDAALTASGGDGSGFFSPAVAGALIAGIAIAGLGYGVLRGRGNVAKAIHLPAAAAMLVLAMSCSGAGSNSLSSQTGSTTAPIVIAEGSVPARLPVTVQSADGRQVTVTDISRIVPLQGNITEAVFGLGLGKQVVGRDISATFPEASHLPLVTRAHDVSAEAVLSLRPTLVLASVDTGPSSALDHIRNVGIPVIRFAEPKSVEDILPRLRGIAAALGVPEAGEVLVKRTEAELAAVRKRIPAGATQPRVAFLYMRGQAGVYLIAGPNSGADSIIRAVGGIDAGTAMGLNNAFTPITSEALVQAAPDVILMTTTGLASVGGLDGLIKIPGIAQTPAGRSKHVVTLEDGLLFSFGPRTPVALDLLITDIYPGAAKPAQ